MVPVQVGGVVHHEQAAMGKLQLHRLYVPRGVFPSGSSVPEEEVPAGPKGHGSNGTLWNQLSLVITVLPHVITPVFVPVGEEYLVLPPVLLACHMTTCQRHTLALSGLNKACLPDSANVQLSSQGQDPPSPVCLPSKITQMPAVFE